MFNVELYIIILSEVKLHRQLSLYSKISRRIIVHHDQLYKIKKEDCRLYFTNNGNVKYEKTYI